MPPKAHETNSIDSKLQKSDEEDEVFPDGDGLLWTSDSDSGMMVEMNALAQRGTARYLHDRHRALQSLLEMRGVSRRTLPYTFLRNEPISFSRTFLRMSLFYKGLCRLQSRLQMGSFRKNEPIFGGLFEG